MPFGFGHSSGGGGGSSSSSSSSSNSSNASTSSKRKPKHRSMVSRMWRLLPSPGSRHGKAKQSETLAVMPEVRASVMRHVLRLHCSRQRLESMPQDLGFVLPNLRELDVSGNRKLRALPPTVAMLQHLTSLKCSSSMINALPDLSRMLALEELIVNNSKLTALPPSVWHLPALRVLRAQHNRIARLDLRLTKKNMTASKAGSGAGAGSAAAAAGAAGLLRPHSDPSASAGVPVPPPPPLGGGADIGAHPVSTAPVLGKASLGVQLSAPPRFTTASAATPKRMPSPDLSSRGRGVLPQELDAAAGSGRARAATSPSPSHSEYAVPEDDGQDIILGCRNTLEEVDLTGNLLAHVPAALGQLCKLRELRLQENNAWASRNFHEAPPRVLRNAEGRRARKLLVLLAALRGTSSSDAAESKSCAATATATSSTRKGGVRAAVELVAAFVGLEDGEFVLGETLFRASQTQLTTLTASYGLRRIPDTLGLLASLTVLKLHSNRLTALPSSVSDLAHLETLSVEGNRLSGLPPLHKLTRLRELNCSNNAMTEPPVGLAACPRLKLVNLACNRLTSLDGRQLPATLRKLEVDHNRLTAVPDVRHMSAALTYLKLNDNDIGEIPPWLGAQMTALHESHSATLTLGGNPVTEIPDTIRALASYKGGDLLLVLPVAQEVVRDAGTGAALYIGGFPAAKNRAFLEARKITAILNLVGGRKMKESVFFPDDPALEYKNVDLRDCSTQDILSHLRDCNAFIASSLRAGRGVLCHCHQGVSRSAAVSIAYLMAMPGPLPEWTPPSSTSSSSGAADAAGDSDPTKLERRSYELCRQVVHSQRPCINPNRGFIEQLCEFETRIAADLSAGGVVAAGESSG